MAAVKKSDLRKILIVEDDLGLQSQLKWCFEDYDITMVDSRNQALACLKEKEISVVVLDLGLPPDHTNVSEGFSALEEIVDTYPRIKVIIVTGNDDKENALKAIEKGAYDFYQKPIDPDVLKIIIKRAFKFGDLEQELIEYQKSQQKSPLTGIITCSPNMLQVCRMVEKIASTDITTMLIGESGTGKEVIARAIHGLSNRRNGPFIAINCAAIPENLLESELFGYEKGSFTGAVKQTIGKIECANKGTLFLDEIGDLALPLQGKLLRFLQERVIERIGGRSEIPVDVRVICATHQNLAEMIKVDTFREDLYYRFSEIVINIPPLRERKGDSILLARAFAEKFSNELNIKIKNFTKSALDSIENYEWPGNIRELENGIKRAVILAEGKQIDDLDIGLSTPVGDERSFNLKDARESVEREMVIRALAHVGDNIVKAAELLGVSRPTLYGLISKYGIK